MELLHKKERHRMEPSDIQFKAFVRFLLTALHEVVEETDDAKKSAKMESVLRNLEQVLAY
jgi:hypothetical protein